MQSIGRKADSKQLRMAPRRTAPPVSRSAFMSSSNTSLSTLRTHNQRVVEQPHNIRHPYSYSYTTSPGPSVLEFPNRGTMKDSPSAGYTWLSELNYYDSDVSMGQFASRIKAQSNHKLNSKASSISGTSVASTTRTYATAQSQSAHPLVRPLPPIPASNPPDKPKKKRHVPPPLQLADSARRMEGLAPVLDNEVSIPPSSLLSPNISTAALTPISPAFKKPSEHEQRRRKMMKVGKIFGENVPVDLVLPPRRSSEDIPPVPALPPIATGAGPRAEDNTGDDSNRRSSLTLPSLGLSSLTAAIRPKKPEAIRPKVVRKKKSFKSHREGARRRSSNHDLRATRSPTLPTHPARFQLIVQDEDSKDTKSDDEDYQLVQSLPYRSRIEPGYFPTLARDAPFLYAQLPGSPGLQGDGRHGVLRRERRQGWSGEWNQEDIQEVITKLRELK
ncbi:hypothetical protein BDQ17DRAFT_1414896 [Cyathus striatus]|nr:hypothetical protein BDQ17DRAFT_1414896 [Cyathus striatus]